MKLREQVGGPSGKNEPGRYSGTRATVASLAAIGSVLAASSCCLPLFPFMLAAGLTGGSAVLSVARPYLLSASILFIAYGFYQTWRAKKCQRTPGMINSVLLWTSTAFVIISIFFPQALANAAASLLPR
jgi:hypothetical protein